MNILVIDTATNVEIIAGMAGNNYSEQTAIVSVSHSTTLLTGIDRVLKNLGIAINDLDIIGAGIGPGSFTGIRIAVTTARMISQIQKIPCVGINTQLLYAFSAGEKADPGDKLLISFDAKKGKVFGALYECKGTDDLPDEIISPGDYEITHLLEKISKNEKVLSIGDGCKKYFNEINKAVPRNQYFDEYLPSGRKICDLVKKLYLKNPDKYNNYNELLPFYSRKSDAEVIRDRKRNSE